MIVMRSRARRVLVTRVSAKFITLSRILSRLIDWKSIVLFILRE